MNYGYSWEGMDMEGGEKDEQEEKKHNNCRKEKGKRLLSIASMDLYTEDVKGIFKKGLNIF